MGKKATAWRMNQSIEPVLSLISSLPFRSSSLTLSLSLSFPIFSSFASRSVLSWNIYSSPGPASLNRHTNLRLNIAQCSLRAFPICQQPQNTAIGRSHPLGPGRVSPRRPRPSLRDALRRMAAGRKCAHAGPKDRDPPPSLAAAHSRANSDCLRGKY